MTDEDERAVRAAADGELRLLEPEVRASPALVSELLDPEFTEIGASGRWWDASSILTVTSAGTVSAESPRTWRSSLWRLTSTGWRLYFHQGTVAG